MSKYYINGSSVQESSKKLVQVNKTIDLQINILQSIVNNFGHDEYAMLKIRSDIKRTINHVKDSKYEINLMKTILDDIVMEYQKSENQNYSAINQFCIVDLKTSDDKDAFDIANEIFDKINSPETLLDFINDSISDGMPVASLLTTVLKSSIFDNENELYTINEKGSILKSISKVILHADGVEVTEEIAGNVLKTTTEYSSDIVKSLKTVGYGVDFFLNLNDYADDIGEGAISVDEAIVRSGMESVVNAGVGTLVTSGIVLATGAAATAIPVIVASAAIGIAINIGFEAMTGKDVGRFVTDVAFDVREKTLDVVGDVITTGTDMVNDVVGEASEFINNGVGSVVDGFVNCFNKPNVMYGF